MPESRFPQQPDSRRVHRFSLSSLAPDPRFISPAFHSLLLRFCSRTETNVSSLFVGLFRVVKNKRSKKDGIELRDCMSFCARRRQESVVPDIRHLCRHIFLSLQLTRSSSPSLVPPFLVDLMRVMSDLDSRILDHGPRISRESGRRVALVMRQLMLILVPASTPSHTLFTCVSRFRHNACD